MKYIASKSMLFIAAAVFVLSSCNVTSHTEKAAGVNFSAYKTFGWVEGGQARKKDRADNGIIDNNIKNAVSEELIKKGWTETETNPDVLLDYTIAVLHETKTETAPVYAAPFTSYLYGRRGIYSIWHPYSLVGVRYENVPFKEGELSVNMMEAKTNKLIWQGWSKGEISSKNITTRDVTQQIKSMFRKF